MFFYHNEADKENDEIVNDWSWKSRYVLKDFDHLPRNEVKLKMNIEYEVFFAKDFLSKIAEGSDGLVMAMEWLYDDLMLEMYRAWQNS